LSTKRSNILLTGRPGVGKTSLVEKALAAGVPVAGGFTTREIREAGVRVGFRMAAIGEPPGGDLRPREGVLAHVNFRSPYRVGRYGVNVKAFDEVGVAAVRAAIGRPGVIVMDEIGRMELYSELFQRLVIQALDAPQPVLGVIQQRRSPLLDGIRERPDVAIVTVTEKNRNALPDAIAQGLRGRRG